MDVDTNSPWHLQKMPFVPIRLARPRTLHGPELGPSLLRLAFQSSLMPFSEKGVP